MTGERPKADTVEWVLLGLSSPYFWDCVEYLVDYIETLPKVGRPRQHTVADWVLFWRASETKSSLRGADDLFVKAGNWLEAREVVAERGWTHPEYQLSETQIDRHQFHRFAKRYINEERIKELRKLVSSNAVKDARMLGLFPERSGSAPTLNVDRVVYGDGSELKTMFNQRRRRVDPDTGEITYSRHDPEAIPHHKHVYVVDPRTGKKVCEFCNANKGRKHPGGIDGTLMHEMVTLLTRTDKREGRILLDIDLREQHETDGTKFADMLLDLKRSNQQLTNLSLVSVYDGRLSAVDADRLEDDGNPVIRKVANAPKGRIKIRTLDDQKFTLADGSKAVRDLHFVDGTPALKEYDGNADEWFVKLTRTDIEPQKRITSKGDHYDIYVTWVVADHPLASKWAGAQVRVRNNSTQKERRENSRRSVFTRVCPESDPEHQKLFGRREDSESFNTTYKNRLSNKRVRSRGRVRNQLNLLAFQMNENDKAMYAHFHRTGYQAAYDERFSYRPKRLKKPLLKAA